VSKQAVTVIPIASTRTPYSLAPGQSPTGKKDFLFEYHNAYISNSYQRTTRNLVCKLPH